ncbi:MAG: penicillin acylase family protein [Alphaproteobacteria bacterium]
MTGHRTQAGRKSLRTIAALGVTLAMSGCAFVTPLPPPATLDERLAAFPTRNLPIDGPVTIHFDQHQVPFIEAQSDDDLAVALGLVHAHLRLGQMEILRRIAQGRISEMAGPIARDIDHSLRILGFGRAAPEVIANMPPDTRRWLDGYVRGVNHYLATTRDLPHEFAVLGLAREPWRAEDVITLGRLAGTDVNWLIWFRLLKLRERPDWPTLWARLVEAGSDSLPSAGAPVSQDLAALDEILRGTSRSGSNAIAVSGRRSATGSAIIASDPHLGLFLPNLWVLGGYKSPSHHAVGLMVPGLPFIAVGRNPWIAWGGTNMRAASSDLVRLDPAQMASIRSHTESVKSRWWFPREVTVRNSEFGPLISDAPVLHPLNGPPLALAWVGHRPTDEITAMLRMNRARNWSEFRAALEPFGVSAQNMIYADAEGHVGLAAATQLPRRANGAPADMVVAPDTATKAWETLATTRDLPAIFDPAEGFVASANNRIKAVDVPIGYFFSPNDRISRLNGLLRANGRVSVADMMALQQDVFMESALRLRNAILGRQSAVGMALAKAPGHRVIVDLLNGWDGHYRMESRGPIAFEAVLHAVEEAAKTLPDGIFYEASGRGFDQVIAAPDRLPDSVLSAALERGFESAARALETYGTWGDMHRLVLAHPLSNLPIGGGRYRFVDVPTGGSSQTIMKTAHDTTAARHSTRYGSNARHISSLADPDANYFALLGGQDGWINSSTFIDQVTLWRAADYIQVPLRLEAIRAAFAHRVVLTGGATDKPRSAGPTP